MGQRADQSPQHDLAAVPFTTAQKNGAPTHQTGYDYDQIDTTNGSDKIAGVKPS
jgi:hypothetical protein